ncbi:MAG TPA: hypothetical protein VFY45_14210 [Baekduia sp.]|nr:hypothetical protein [Baekduia sp.]
MLAPSRLSTLCAIAIAALAIPATASAAKSSPKLPAKFQKRYHVKSAVADPDRDGLTNLTEYRAHTSPKKPDTDRDGTEDGSEDRDGDKLDNATEQRAGTNPSKRDTNHNGRPDGREDADHDGLRNLAEQRTANDPRNADSDGDGIKDGGENAGQVVSFAGGVLALRLASTGKVVTGNVGDATNVACNGTAGYKAAYGGGTAEDLADDDDAFDDEDFGDDDAFDEEGDASASSDDSGDDEATASTAALRAAGDEGTGDPCIDDVLAPGAWVHEAELAAGDDGTSVFDTVALVDDTL